MKPRNLITLLVTTSLLILVAFIVINVVYALISPPLHRQDIASTKNSTKYQVVHYETNRDNLVIITVLSRQLDSTEVYIARETPYGTGVIPDAVDGKCILEVDEKGNGILHVTPDEGACKS